jgi:hypothetical protein
VLLDDLWIPPGSSGDVREAVTSFLKKSVRDGDEVTVATTTGRLWWSARMPAGREEYVNPHLGIDQMRGGGLSFTEMSEYQAFLIVEGRADAREIASASREANTAIYFLDVRGLRPTSGYGAQNVAPPPEASKVGQRDIEDNVLATAGTQDLICSASTRPPARRRESGESCAWT